MKQVINVKFVDFWDGFDNKKNLFYNLLSQKYNVVISDNPTYLIFSVFGHENLKYNCIKIFYTGENIVPDFNITDYAIGFDHITFSDRYVRIPLYVLYSSFKSLKEQKIIDRDKVLNRKFCSFVYSNNTMADSARSDFYNILSKYKHIDSGGAMFNNIGERVKDKIDFIKNYKFNIAFENCSSDGYTTEKIVEPMSVNSLPIYWGNPSIEKDFNPKSFINANDFNSLDELASYIKYLDENDDAYIEKLSEPYIINEDTLTMEQKLTDFLFNIVSQDPLRAKRIPSYGCTVRYRSELLNLVNEKQRKNKSIFSFIYKHK